MRDVVYASVGDRDLHLDPSDPPLLIMHGDQDNQVPINQSHEPAAAYRNAGCSVHFEVVPGAGHSDDVYYRTPQLDVLESFLSRTLTSGSR